MKTQFEIWWNNEGSQGPGTENDLESWMKERCRTAWENGAYCAMEKLDEALKTFNTGGYVEMMPQKPYIDDAVDFSGARLEAMGELDDNTREFVDWEHPDSDLNEPLG